MMEEKQMESISVAAAIETILSDVCSIEDILFEYTGGGRLEEHIINKTTLKTRFSDHIKSIKVNIEMVKTGKLKDDAIEQSNKNLVYLAGKCYTTNQFYYAMYNHGDSDAELDSLWKQFLDAMYDFNEAIKSDVRIYNMSKALDIYKDWTKQA